MPALSCRIQFKSRKEAEDFMAWATRTREEGTELSDHLTGPLLVPALVALDHAEIGPLKGEDPS